MTMEKKLLKELVDSVNGLNQNFETFGNEAIIANNLIANNLETLIENMRSNFGALAQNLQKTFDPSLIHSMLTAYGPAGQPKGWLRKDLKEMNSGFFKINNNLGSIANSLISLPRSLSSFLGWGQLYSLFMDNPVTNLAINLGKSLTGLSGDLAKALFGKKKDVDDVRRENEENRGFFKKIFAPMEKLLEGIYDKIQPFDPFKEKGDKDKSIFGKLLDIMAYPFKKLMGLLGPLFTALGGGKLVSAVSSVASGVGKLMMSLFSSIGGVIGGLAGKIGPYLGKFFSGIGKFFSELFGKILPKLASGGEFLAVMGKGLLRFVGATAGFLIDFVFGAMKGGVGEGIRQMIFGEKGMIGGIFNTIKYAILGAAIGGPVGLVVGAITGLITSYIKNVLGDQLAGKGVIETVGLISGYFAGMIGNALKSVWEAVKSVGSTLWGAFKFVGEKIWGAVKWVSTALTDAFSWYIDFMWKSLKWIGKSISGIFTWLMAPSNWRLIFSKLLEGVKSAGSKIWESLKGIGSWVIDKLDKLWTWIVDGFMDMVGSFMGSFAKGLKFYTKYQEDRKLRELEQEKLEKLEKKKKLEDAKKEREEELKRKKEDERLSKEQQKTIGKGIKIEDARNKIIEKAKSLAEKIADMSNEIGGAMFQFLAAGAATGYAAKPSAGLNKALYEASQQNIRGSNERIRRIEQAAQKAKEAEFAGRGGAGAIPPIVNNVNNVSNNSSVSVSQVMEDSSFDFPGDRKNRISPAMSY